MAVMDLDALETEVRTLIDDNLTDATIPVYNDFPRFDLNKGSLPRVTVQVIPAAGQYLSIGLTLTSQRPLVITTVFVRENFTNELRSLITEVDGIFDTNSTSLTNAKVLTPISASGTEAFEFDKFSATMRSTVWEAWVLSN